MNVYTSPELFNLLPDKEKNSIYPESLAQEAMGITEFTFPTLYRWVVSREGRKKSLQAFSRGGFSGSGQADKVLEEAGLNAENQLRTITAYAESFERSRA